MAKQNKTKKKIFINVWSKQWLYTNQQGIIFALKNQIKCPKWYYNDGIFCKQNKAIELVDDDDDDDEKREEKPQMAGQRIEKRQVKIVLFIVSMK